MKGFAVKFSVNQIWAAAIAAALGFVPAPIRWAVRLVADQFASKSKDMPAGSLDKTVTADAPDGLKQIIQALFDGLAARLDGRPFLQAAVKAVGTFVVNNLLDVIFDSLTNNGARAAAGSVPLHYDPKAAEALEKELALAVELDG